MAMVFRVGGGGRRDVAVTSWVSKVVAGGSGFHGAVAKVGGGMSWGVVVTITKKLCGKAWLAQWWLEAT